jgi:hypothetical protein
MTEDQIERKAERFMDHLDRLLLAGELTDDDYSQAVQDVAAWAELRYRFDAKREREQWAFWPPAED